MWMGFDDLSTRGKIVTIIGPEEKPRRRSYKLVEFIQKMRLKNPILMMPSFRPRIGKENENSVKPRFWGESGEKVLCACLHKGKKIEARPMFFSISSNNSLRYEVDSKAAFTNVRGCIGAQEVAMTATNLKSDSLSDRKFRCRELLKADLSLSGSL